MDSGALRIDSMEPDNAEIKFSKAYPLEFCYVKSTFLQKQYRQCISTCRQILEIDHDEQPAHPLKQTFMRLYTALAHDELARSMHNFSSTKLSAFYQAQSLYEEAAATIPDADECHRLLREHDPSLEHGVYQSSALLPQSESHSTLDSDVFRRAPSPSPFLSPPTQAHASIPDITSPDSSSSEQEDDLESHDSSGEIVTPPRIQRLPSTFSSMSLLEPQKQAHGLLRPVRPGSTAKPYQAPPNFSPSPKQYRSRLPRLNTGSSLASPGDTSPRQTSPVRKQLRSPDEQWSPVGSPTSPVSSLGSAYIGSDDMTISPLSPSTPITAKAESYFADAAVHSMTDTHGADPLTAHAESLRSQIDTHIRLLQQEREHTVAAQKARADKNSMRKIPPSNTVKLNGGVPQSRSFWLFTPQDVKIQEKQRRIESGRERMWSRPRFDPSRYQGLAERALAEL